jgi:hypothetical protein
VERLPLLVCAEKVLSRALEAESTACGGLLAFVCRLQFFDNRICYGRDTLAAPLWISHVSAGSGLGTGFDCRRSLTMSSVLIVIGAHLVWLSRILKALQSRL